MSTDDCSPWVLEADPNWVFASLHTRPNGHLVLGGRTGTDALLVGVDPFGVIEWTFVLDPTLLGFEDGNERVDKIASLSDDTLVLVVGQGTSGTPDIVARFEVTDMSITWAHLLDNAFAGDPWGLPGPLSDPPVIQGQPGLTATPASGAIVLSALAQNFDPFGGPPRLLLRLHPNTGQVMWHTQAGSYNGAIVLDDENGRVVTVHGGSSPAWGSLRMTELSDGSYVASISNDEVGFDLSVDSVVVRPDGLTFAAFSSPWDQEPTYIGVWNGAFDLLESRVLEEGAFRRAAVDDQDRVYFLRAGAQPCGALVVRVDVGSSSEYLLNRPTEWSEVLGLQAGAGSAVHLRHADHSVRQICLP